MTRVLTQAPSGVLLSDQGADRIDLLQDLNRDGDAADPGERSLFFGTGAPGFADPATNVFTLVQASDGAVYAGDGNADAVYRLVDRNGDGDAMDEGEATVWLAQRPGLTLPTPNGLAEGPDGAIYVVNAGVASRPQDAIWRTEDLNGDGDAMDEGETRLWLDLSAVSAASAPFELAFIGAAAYLLDPNGPGAQTIWRIEDADGSGAISADEVSVFIDSDQSFGAPLDFSLASDGESLYVWEWLDFDTGVNGLHRLTDLDGSGAIDAAAEAVEVWTSESLPEGFAAFAGFSVAADEDGRVAVTSNDADPGGDFVALLEDRNGDGDFLDAGETTILGSRVDDAAGYDRPRAAIFYDGLVAPAPTLAGAGNHFSLFLDREAGVLYAAGENVVDQLGQGVGGFDVPAPLAVRLPDGFNGAVASVSAGLVHGAFLTEDGDVYAWGLGNFGRLGLGDEENRSVPTKIGGALDERKVALIDMGNGASYAVTEDGALWAWGQNSNGQLGLGDREERLTPTRVEALAEEAVVALSSGTSHTLALTADGDVFAWGSGRNGRLGSPDALDGDGEPLARALSPVRVEGLPEDAAVVAVTADTQTSYAVMSDGRVFGWGEGRFGQLGRGVDLGDGTFAPDPEPALAPVEIPGPPSDVVDVKGGARWAVALTGSGEVWMWGPNDEGPSGGLDGAPGVESDGSFFPTKIDAFDGETIVEIQTGPNHVIAVTAEGRFLTFGANSDGRLGYPTDGLTTEPAEVALGGDLDPWLLAATPGDNGRDVAADADVELVFTEAVVAGPGAIRFVNRDDPADAISVAAAEAAIDGAVVRIDPPGLFRPDARYAVEIDPDAVLDLDGRAYAGLGPEDASDFDFRIDAAAPALVGSDGRDGLRGADADELIWTGAGRGDVSVGGGGADRFVFGAETANGVREYEQIRDYEIGLDVIDLGGAEIAAIRESRGFVALTLDGDGDSILIRGVSDFDDIAFV